jgi:hypothetical protein
MRKPFRGVQSNLTHPSAGNLVGDYVLNENAGKIAFDYSRNGNKGTITGATWGPNGLIFGGSPDWMSLPALHAGETGKDVTYIAEIAPIGIVGNVDIVSQANLTTGIDFIRLQTRTQRIGAIIRNSASATITLLPPAVPFVIGKKATAVLTKRGTTWTLYIDGVPVDSNTLADSFTFTAASLGSWPSGGSNFFIGEINNALIYDNRALLPAEIEEHISKPYRRFKRPSRARYFFVPSVVVIPDTFPHSNKFKEVGNLTSQLSAVDSMESGLKEVDNLQNAFIRK